VKITIKHITVYVEMLKIDIKQGNDLVSFHESEHLRLNLTLNDDSPQRQNRHGTRLEICIASNAYWPNRPSHSRDFSARACSVGTAVSKARFCEQTKWVEAVVW